MYYMDNKVRLFLLTTSCISVLSAVFMRIFNDNNNNLTFSQELCFIILLFSPILMIINVLLKCVYVNMHIDMYNPNPKHSILVLIFKTELIIFIILAAVNYADLYNTITKFETLRCIIGMLVSWTLEQVISLSDQNRESTFLCIDSMHGLDYGTAMAYSYYYGYLKIILPTTGSLNKGITEKIENIEDNHNIRIAIHKLLILIPASSYIPPDLKEVSFQWIESAVDLEPEVRDRAGVKRRSYHNNLYKIYPNGKISNSVPVYIVAEGATPLLTFFEVQKHIHPETNVYQKYRRDIITNFYKKLKELISNDPECMDLCELIYYNDYDSSGNKVNVAEVILDRLNINQKNKLNTNTSL